MTNSIDIKVAAAVDDAVKALGKVDQAVASVGKTSTETGKKTGLSFTEINSAISLASRAVDSFKEAYNFAKEGAQVDSLRT